MPVATDLHFEPEALCMAAILMVDIHSSNGALTCIYIVSKNLGRIPTDSHNETIAT